jgi:hypothetical protein
LRQVYVGFYRGHQENARWGNVIDRNNPNAGR